MGKGKTQQGSTLGTLCHCLVSPHCSALCCPESHQASTKHSIHNKEKQTLHHPSSLDVQRTRREIFVDCSELFAGGVLCWHLRTATENQKNLWAEDAIRRRCHRKDRFQNWWPCLTLISSAWEEMMRESYRWSRSALEQIIWFPCLTDRNPAAFLWLSSDILTWSQSINQSEALCLFWCVENVEGNVKAKSITA